MSSFAGRLVEATRKDRPVVHGIIAKCVDKTGRELYSKITGYDSVLPDAKPLQEDAVFKIASCTKLVTSISMLQCIERGLLTLDEPIEHVLPELGSKNIVTRSDSNPATPFTYRDSHKKITARHLLTHTSGMAYHFTDSLTGEWAKQNGHTASHLVAEKYDVPLLFEPGDGWAYGPGLDWAGIAVARLTGLNLEDYMEQEIWQRLGLPLPHPTFHISRQPEYMKRLMFTAHRQEDGTLAPYEPTYGDNPVDEEGGNGLALTVNDYLAITQDLIADSPKLLSSQTVNMLFSPQFPPDSPALHRLRQSRHIWDMLAGPVSDQDVNHGIGALLTTGDAPDIHQPKNCLAWTGACNTVWFANKDLGIAGIFATQISPFMDAEVHKLVNAWKQDFWKKCLQECSTTQVASPR